MPRKKTTTDATAGANTEKKPQATRVYVVTDNATGKPIALIDTTSEAKARAHHADKTFTVKYAEQKDIFAAAKEGIEIQRPDADPDAPAAGEMELG